MKITMIHISVSIFWLCIILTFLFFIVALNTNIEQGVSIQGKLELRNGITTLDFYLPDDQAGFITGETVNLVFSTANQAFPATIMEKRITDVYINEQTAVYYLLRLQNLPGIPLTGRKQLLIYRAGNKRNLLDLLLDRFYSVN